jgi:hypothetical protein
VVHVPLPRSHRSRNLVTKVVLAQKHAEVDLRICNFLLEFRLYYQYVPEGKEYPVLSRKLRPSSGLVGTLLDYLSGSEKEQMLLDWNEVAEKNGRC